MAPKIRKSFGTVKTGGKANQAKGDGARYLTRPKVMGRAIKKLTKDSNSKTPK